MLKRLKEEGRLREGRPEKQSQAATVSVNDLGLTKSDSSRDQMLADLYADAFAWRSEEAELLKQLNARLADLEKSKSHNPA